MTTVIDIGNARIKWARVEHGRLTARGSALHAEALDDALAQLADWLPERVGRVLVSNVAGDAIAQRVTEIVIQRGAAAPEFAATRAEQLGVRCGYAEPERLGVDRWIALIAAWHQAGGAACVIDAGTAVTFDAIAHDGRHLGGLIFAGPRLTARALLAGTRNIGPTGGVAEPPDGLDLLGRCTDRAVGHATMLALAAGIDRAAATVAAALGGPPVVLLTGGDAPVLEPWLETGVEHRADLVLEGLALIAGRG